MLTGSCHQSGKPGLTHCTALLLYGCCMTAACVQQFTNACCIHACWCTSNAVLNAQLLMLVSCILAVSHCCCCCAVAAATAAAVLLLLPLL
jgi:hypothetical protein